ncbi:ATP-dependent Clp protease adaptor ClpS [Limnoglobus roseus]|uniref:ATP-dependent Clp protease adaptor ClpS n=1 Tax=Limnoglobus roseus TaxID=2598579 RepID=A0A5C1AR50_9BACT|nr:ATP-dependent Clp protease adaptor ClpS [Limnoglobus roseus]QEL21095.1 ATP-dependent Clp protease adaptor ClpS [Limnoglobus roseus]
MNAELWGGGLRTRARTRPPRYEVWVSPDERSARRDGDYVVVLFDDDEHSFAFVIEALVSVCGLSERVARHLANVVDQSGRAVIHAGTAEDCEEKRAGVEACGPGPRMTGSVKPLRAEVERRG